MSAKRRLHRSPALTAPSGGGSTRGVVPVGRRIGIATIALALSAAIGLTTGATAGLADTGSVYTDTNGNTAAGSTLFSGGLNAFDNVGLGFSVMPFVTTGSFNLATGAGALISNTTGADNVATGAFALNSNGTGADNFAGGFQALASNTTGKENVASGSGSLTANTTGRFNLAGGSNALSRNTTGHDNTALGRHALDANTSGDSNLALGSAAGEKVTTGSDNVEIANPGVAGESGRIRIGTDGKQTAAFIAGVSGVSVGGSTQPVVINAAGKLGTAPARAAGLVSSDPRLLDELERQQREIDRLREQLQEVR